MKFRVVTIFRDGSIALSSIFGKSKSGTVGMAVCLAMFGVATLAGLQIPLLASDAYWTPSTSEVAIADDGSAKQRSPRSIRKDLDAFVKRSRTSSSDTELSDAVFDMCRLHSEIVNDSRFAKSKDLQGYRRILWTRLTTIKTTIERKVARETKEVEKEIRKRLRDGSIDKQTAQKMRMELALKRQGQSEDGQDHGRFNETESEDTPSYGDFTGISDQLAEQMAMANQFTGGPAQVFAYASGRPAGPPDYGPDLVRLIEETIDPDFWERNGGPGRIHYYKPLRIIVVGGSLKVQDNIQSMLKTLRMLDR